MLMVANISLSNEGRKVKQTPPRNIEKLLNKDRMGMKWPRKVPCKV